MAKSPDKPTGSSENETPWVPSPGSQDPVESATAAAEGFDEGATSAEEAIGGGSRRAVGQSAAEAARGLGADAVEKGQAAADRVAAGTLTLRDALKDAIVAQPMAAVTMAAIAGFVAAVLFRR